MSTRKPALTLALFGLFACGPQDDPEPLTQPQVPVASENGYYQLSAEPENGGKNWPKWALGPTTIAAYIEPGPDPLPNPDPELDPLLPATPPYKVKVKAPLADTDERAPVPQATPLDTEGKHWALGPLELKNPGYWVVPVEISNDDGVIDTVELRFQVE